MADFRGAKEGDRMNLHIYAKTDTDLSCFDSVIDVIREESTEIDIITENRRSFRSFEALRDAIPISDAIIINDIGDLGTNSIEISNRLDWFVQKDMFLVINNIPSTYIYGIAQPTNKAILSTLLQQIVADDKNILMMTKKPSVGRNKIEFPENWDELYKEWDRKAISSKAFIERCGLKKATFYNLLTEYKLLQQTNNGYIERYKRA